MPDQEIAVKFAEVQNAAASISATSKHLNGKLEQLQGDLAPLSAAYTGEAKELWFAAQRRWDQAQESLNQVLASIGTATQQAAEGYQNTEKKNTGLWNG